MSLEQSILELTDAVKLLTATLAVQGIATAPLGIDQSPERDAYFEAIRKERKEIYDAEKKAEVVKEPKAKEETVKPVKVPNEQQPTTTDTLPPSEPESAPVSYDDVKRAINALSAAKGKEVTIALLDKFGVKRGPELDEAQWADFIKEAQIG